MTIPAGDPLRLGHPGWLAATGGRLTAAQQATMVLPSLRSVLELVWQRLTPRRPASLDLETVFTPPDSRLARLAEEAATVQPPALLGHAHRTAVFARALSLVDGTTVDPELLYAASLLHDVGLVRAVTGEDFTLRSAQAAERCAEQAGRPETGPLLADAVVAHTTVGVDVEHDGPLACYVQWGAMVDLVGLRERHLAHALVARAVAEHPRDGFAPALLDAVRAEARAVPAGRFAFLRLVGFPLAVRLAAVPSRP